MSDETKTKVDEAASAEQMAEAIRKISDAAGKMLRAGLNRRALVVLLKDYSGVPMAEIAKVLDWLDGLAATYTTKRAVRK
jgi:hypothetical protein